MTDEEVAAAVQQHHQQHPRSVRVRAGVRRRSCKRAGFQTPQEFRRYRMEEQRRALLQNRLIETPGIDRQKLPPIATDGRGDARVLRRYVFRAGDRARGRRPSPIPADRGRPGSRLKRPRTRRMPRPIPSSFFSGPGPILPNSPGNCPMIPDRRRAEGTWDGSVAV